MLEHVLSRVNTAEILPDPYPHIIVDSVFPEAFYGEMLAHFPNPDEMVHPSSELRTYTNVRQCDLVPDPAVVGARDGAWAFGSLLAGEKKHFWSAFKARLFSDEIFTLALAAVFGDELLDLPHPPAVRDLYPVGRLAIDYEGAGLGPHTDHRRKVISVLFYLADGTEDAEACGTQLFRPKVVPPETGQHMTFDDVVAESKKVAEFVPNRMVAWAVSPDSVHAYHQTWGGPRRSIKMFIQRRDVDNDEAAAELAETGVHSEEWRR